MKAATPFALVVTTVARKTDAKRLARLLLQQRLAACVQILPIESYYWWKGQIERNREFRLEAKTTARHAPTAMTALASAHPYEIPEILILPFRSGHPPYLHWLKQETQSAR